MASAPWSLPDRSATGSALGREEETLEEPRRCAEAGRRAEADGAYIETRSLRKQRLEFVLMCLCSVAGTVDYSLLPVFFMEFQVLWGVPTTSLSMLSTIKGWMFAVFALPSGFMAELLPRPRLISLGMMLWALGLGLCAVAGSFKMLFFGRLLNGVGLGLVYPLLLSLMADKTPPWQRGSAFGSLFFAGKVCSTLFDLLATKYAATKFAGIAGWRLSTAILALLSGLIGAVFTLVIVEPNAEHLGERRARAFLSVFVDNLPKVWQLFKRPTFVLILCQGAPGSAPWTVFPFFTQWLELSCFTHGESAGVFSALGWGVAFSSLGSGLLLNCAERRWPDHGPPTMANFSVGIGIPFLTLFFFVLPKPEELGVGHLHLLAYGFSFLLFGLGAGMCGVVNKKVFSDIVPRSIFTYAFAVDAFIEGSVSNIIGLLVGVVTDRAFHYDVHAAVDKVRDEKCAPEEAKKLGMGMFVVCNVAWAICFCVYLGMHYTYPRDRRRQAALHAERAEMTAWAPEAVTLGAARDQLDDE